MADDSFAPVLSKNAKKNRKNKYFRPEKTIDDYTVIFKRKHEILQDSTFIIHLKEVLYNLISREDRSNITHIRCIAIGQPTEADAVMYQASILSYLQEWFSVDGSRVSVWDPIINDKDREFFTKVMGITISEDDFKDIDPANILWYAPHAPISVMESLLQDRKSGPMYFLANFIPDYETRLLSKDLKTKYLGLDKAIQTSNQPDLKLLGKIFENENSAAEIHVDELPNILKTLSEVKITDREKEENAEKKENAEIPQCEIFGKEDNKTVTQQPEVSYDGELKNQPNGKWNCFKLNEKLSDDEVWRLAVNDLGVHVWVS